jgi:undecaprenyl-diphosphatase
MSLIQIIILGIIQGLAELLPVSSSAHVILAQHLMGLDPSAPEMTFFLVMLHTGTMFAVLLYFMRRWITLLKNSALRIRFLKALIIATTATGVLGLALKYFIEHVILEYWLGHTKGEVEALFSVLPLMAAGLFTAGALIIIAGRYLQKSTSAKDKPRSDISQSEALTIGLVQGLCLPIRGFSRSGATISTALLKGISRSYAEDFSFALAVILTPPVIAMELRRLIKARADLNVSLSSLLAPGFAGMFFSFLAGLVALKWLSSWLENGRWHYFGYYCVVLSIITAAISLR